MKLRDRIATSKVQNQGTMIHPAVNISDRKL